MFKIVHKRYSVALLILPISFFAGLINRTVGFKDALQIPHGKNDENSLFIPYATRSVT